MDGIETTYIAGRRITVNGERRNRGDLVPEAAGWKNLHSAISSGQIIAVQMVEREGSLPIETLDTAVITLGEPELSTVLGKLSAGVLKSMLGDAGWETDGTKADLVGRLADVTQISVICADEPDDQGLTGDDSDPDAGEAAPADDAG